MTRVICGVDVASLSLEAGLGPEGESASFANTEEGIAELADFCRSHGVDLVVMEATGGYEQRALEQLSAQGIGVARVNPRAVRRFAESMGRLEKTDRIDAGMIAWFAAVKKVRPMVRPTAEQQQLRALSTRLRQLTAIRTAQRNQRRLVSDAQVQASFDQLLEVINRQIEELADRVAQLIAADPLWQQLNQVFRTIKGVADRTVARLLAEMPEIGSLENKTISKLAGLAPLARDSGKQQGKRITRGGRAGVREILFVVAGVVARYEPDFLAFRQRLAAAGKPPKVIRIALAHKLLVRLNAKAREVHRSLNHRPCWSAESTAAVA